jgi:hypothetical protein
MAKSTTLMTARASLCALGEYLRRRCFCAPFHEQVKIAQKVVKYRPIEKLLDGLVGMLCGAKRIAQSNVTIKVHRPSNGPLGARGVPTNPRSHARCTPVQPIMSLNWRAFGGFISSVMGGPHDTPSMRRCCGWMPMSPPCRAEVEDTYDQRAMIEDIFCQDRQGLGLVQRRQHQWEAQQMVLLLAPLAHHLLLWSTRWLSRVPAARWRLCGCGVVRLLQEVGTVPGILRWRRGWMVAIRFIPLHPLAKPLQQSFAALFRGHVRVCCLR